jgi:hypothetical protein
MFCKAVLSGAPVECKNLWATQNGHFTLNMVHKLRYEIDPLFSLKWLGSVKKEGLLT